MTKLAGKVALVTGGSRGIGAAAAPSSSMPTTPTRPPRRERLSKPWTS